MIDHEWRLLRSNYNCYKCINCDMYKFAVNEHTDEYSYYDFSLNDDLVELGKKCLSCSEFLMKKILL